MRCLLTGATGFLGSYLTKRLPADVEALVVSRRPRPELERGNVKCLVADLEDPDSLAPIRSFAPSIVLHLASLTDADVCEREPSRAERVNESATRALASLVEPSCHRFLYVSTDLVFDGSRGNYAESDEARPLSAYGRTKLLGERAAASVLGERTTVARVALLYGRSPGGGARRSFADVMIARLVQGQPVTLFMDQFRTPAHVDDAASSLWTLARLPRVPSLVHIGGPERVSRYEMGLLACETLALSPESLVARKMEEVPAEAPRPVDVSFDTSLARRLGLPARPLREGFRDWLSPSPGPEPAEADASRPRGS